jgi:hypothetical protein
LDQAGRFSVWRKFFELAGCRVGSSDDDFDTLEEESITFAPDDIQELAVKPFNGKSGSSDWGVHAEDLSGRTIKNLVRTAQALALSSYASFFSP